MESVKITYRCQDLQFCNELFTGLSLFLKPCKELISLYCLAFLWIALLIKGVNNLSNGSIAGHSG